MRIGFITYEYPPFVYGGAGVYAKSIVQALAKRGHDVHVFTFSDDLDTNPRIHIHQLGSKRLPKMAWIPSYWFSLYYYFKKNGNDLHLDVLLGNGFSELPLGKGIIGIPRMLVMHQSARRVLQIVKPTIIERLTNINNEMGIAPIFDPMLVKRADKIIAVSDYVKRSLVKDLDIDPGRIEVILNGFDDLYRKMGRKEIGAIKASYGISGKRPILFVGRISDKRKGLMELLKAFSMLEGKEDIALIIAGSGDKAPIEEMIEKLGIQENAKILGRVTDEALKELYNVCDLYVSSSFYESFGLTLVEAMSCEKPVIARDIGGISEVISNENGILLKDNSSDSLADAIGNIISNYKEYEQIGKNNRHYVLNKFSWDKAACLLEGLAMELVDGNMEE